MSQQLSPTDTNSNADFASKVGEPVLSTTTTAKVSEPVLSATTTAKLQPPELAIPIPNPHSAPLEAKSGPYLKNFLQPLDIEISFSASLDSFDGNVRSQSSTDSFATARQYHSNVSLTPDNLINPKHEIDDLSQSSSLVRGPRPQPWDQVEFNDFNIDKDAKTSTTTKAFKKLMKTDSISKMFKAAFPKSVVEQEAIDQNHEISRNTTSRVIGSRVYETSLDQSRISQSQTTSRVRGSRPFKL